MKRSLPAIVALALLMPGLIFVLWNYIPVSVHYHITEAYSFRAGDKEAGIRLAVMIPTSGPYQEVRNVRIAWAGAEARESHRAVEIVKLERQLKARETKVGTIAYDVILHQGGARWMGPLESFQLQLQPGIEADAPAIVQAASQVASGQSRDDAYRIHKFTAAWLSWGSGGATNWESSRLQSAMEAYQRREGVCGDFANLMTAMCRAARIPAQSISGLKLPAYPPFWTATGPAWGSPAATHAWVEFHTRQGWEMADPSAAHWMPVKSLSFGRNDGGYLSYGERIAQDRIWEQMVAWANAKGSGIGSMIGPLRFAAGADGKVSVSPQASLKVTWSGRWLCVLLLISVFMVLMLFALSRWARMRRLSDAQQTRCSEPGGSAQVSNRRSAAPGH